MEQASIAKTMLATCSTPREEEGIDAAPGADEFGMRLLEPAPWTTAAAWPPLWQQ